MAIPLPLRGLDISLVTITPQSVSGTTGVLSDVAGSLATLTAVLDGGAVRNRMTTEEISAITSAYENNVAFQTGWEVTLREIMRRTTSALGATPTGPQLAALAEYLADPANTPYVKITITRGTAPNATWTLYGVLSSFQEGDYAKGKNPAEMSFLPIDNGTANVLA